MPRKRQKSNATGRQKHEGQYARVSYSFWRSDAWRSLSGPAAKIWCELRCRFNGGNNGELYLSMDEAARHLKIGKATAQRAFKELVSKGFIQVTRQGRWYGRQATQYRFTDLPYKNDMPPYTYKSWQRGSKTENGSNTVPSKSPTNPPQYRKNSSVPDWNPSELGEVP
jgi:hypothetical protein